MDFKQSYNHQKFLHFLQHNFLPDDFEIVEEDIDINFKTQFIKKVIFLGKVNSLGLNVYEAYHHSENDPRVSLSSEIFRLLADYGVGRALVIFVSSKSPNYRFSLVTIDLKWLEGKRVKKEYSNPRRYSFYLGSDAKVHTAHDFLVKKGRVKDFEGLIDRFNVEVVTKEFFQKYHELFEKLTKYLGKDNAFKIFAQKNNISIENFAKKLLGQIVFIYFLQRKGWLGAKRENKISQGDKNFLRNLFNKSQQEKKNFFNDYLEPLFYSALNSKSKYAGNFYRDYFDCQIPFLNGGLFEPLNNYDWENEFIILPDKIFSDILDDFDLYNFTVAEDDPIDKEVSIDPEMLGKVFENLLEENLRKGKGTYYTPREIVYYMCQESLINYLATEANINSDEICKKYFPVFNTLDDKEFKTRDVEVDKKIVDSLKKIKVVDPACGSGAFLVGMLQQITKLRFDLENILHILKKQMHKSSEYEIKKESIQNCIYGVDIDPGAIEIAKLRLWLSLVVDYELDQIEPLPNLDYKIMVGNSLIDKAIINDNIIEIFNPADLEEFKENKKFKNLFEEDLQGDIYSWSIRGEINTLVKQFIKTKDLLFRESDFEKKLNLKNKINQLENEIIRVSLKKEFQKVKDQLKKYNLTPTEKIHLEFTKNFLEDLMESDKELNKYKHENIFLWQLNFIEIFREKNGFDVVLANPPYIRHRDLDKNLKDTLKNTYKTGNTTSDIYCYFYELSYNLLCEEGVSTLITSNKWMRAKYGEQLRVFFKENVSLLVILDLGGGQFDSATVDTNILIFRRQKPKNNNYIKYGKATPIPDKVLSVILQDDLNKNTYSLLNKEEIALKKKIEKVGTKLMNWSDIKINYGILTGRNEVKINNNKKEGVFIIDEQKRNKLIQQDDNSKKLLRPILMGKNIYRYGYIWDKKYLVAVHYNMHKEIDNYPAIKSHLTQYKRSLQEKSQVKRGDHHWIELDQNPSSRYMEEFDKDKIAWGNINNESRFCFNKEMAINAPANFITSESVSIKYILAIMNSKIFFWEFKNSGITLGNAFEWKIQYVENIHVPRITNKQQKPFINLVDKILTLTDDEDYLENEEKQRKVKEYELEIDLLVYKLYGLTPEEIEIVEGGH